MYATRRCLAVLVGKVRQVDWRCVLTWYTATTTGRCTRLTRQNSGWRVECGRCLVFEPSPTSYCIIDPRRRRVKQLQLSGSKKRQRKKLLRTRLSSIEYSWMSGSLNSAISRGWARRYGGLSAVVGYARGGMIEERMLWRLERWWSPCGAVRTICPHSVEARRGTIAPFSYLGTEKLCNGQRVETMRKCISNRAKNAADI